MSRPLPLAAAQLGPIARSDTRRMVVQRLVHLLEQAAAAGARLVVFPELALTTFFPRWWMEDRAEIDAFFETAMPGPETRPLFDAATRLGCGFHLGYAELTADGVPYNTAILVDGTGAIVGKYRKVHLPGHADNQAWRPFQHLEKRYFTPGDLGFPVFQAFGGRIGMLVCNDRRWPEAYRMLALGGAEVIVLGYNTPRHYPPVPEHDHLQDFHNHLCLQAGAYQNGCWVVGVAKGGVEEGCDLIAGSCVVAPTGEIVARATTAADELVLQEIDLDRCTEIRAHIFDFAQHRRPETYGLLTARA